MKINRWIFLSLPDLPWVVWRPLSLDLAFLISQELMGIHHGVSKKDKSDKRIFKVYRKFFSQQVTKKWMKAKQFRRSERKQILTVKWKMRWKNYLLFLLHTFWLYCLLYYRRFPLFCIKRDALYQLRINCHFHFLNFPTASSLLHMRKIRYIGPFLKYLAPQNGL